MVFDGDQSIFSTVLQSKVRDNSNDYKTRGVLLSGFLFSGGIVCSSMSSNQLGILH